jgi:hypothetical protein
VAASVTREGYLDLEAVNASGRNGLLRLQAFGILTEQLLRCGKAVCVLGIGLLAMIVPPAGPRVEGQVSPVQVGITVGLFLIALQLLAGTALARRRRTRAREIILKRLRDQVRDDTGQRRRITDADEESA